MRAKLWYLISISWTVFLICCSFQADGKLSNNIPECDCSLIEENVTSEGYYGWPVAISCLELYQYYYYNSIYDYDGVAMKNASCVVMDASSGRVLYNETIRNVYSDMDDNMYITEDITKDTPSEYVVHYKVTNRCTCQHVQILKKHSPSPSCENTTDISKHDTWFGQSTGLLCGTVSPPHLNRLDQTGQLSYKWTRNCRNLSTHEKSIDLDNLSYNDTGIYACYVVYKGRELLHQQEKVCGEYMNDGYKNFSMQCPSTVSVTIGKDVNITCNADLGVGKAVRRLVNTKWNHKSISAANTTSLICKNFIEGKLENSIMRLGITCLTKSNSTKQCYYKPGIPLPEHPPHDIYNVTLMIRNVSFADLGSYNLSFLYVRLEKYQEITLIEDKTVQFAIWLSVIISFVILTCIIILLVLCWKYKHCGA